MKAHLTRRIPVAVAMGLAVAMLALGFVAALGARSLVAGTASASPAAPNPGHSYDQIELPPGTWPELDADRVDGYEASQLGGGGCYINWNLAGCAAGFTVVSTGVWTVLGSAGAGGVVGGSVICAQAKSSDTTLFMYPHSATTENVRAHDIDNEPCAICCK